MQPLLVKAALYTFPLVALFFFSRLPPHRALILTILAGTMFLPEVQLSPVGGDAPDANEFVLLILKFIKPNAICIAALIGVVVFDFKRLRTFRPRWFDLPMFFWCVLTYFSNREYGIGAYDSFAMTRDKTLSWGVPYFLGRIYFQDLGNFRDLAIGIFLAGLYYAPLCIYESFKYPTAHRSLYGFFPGPENEVFRWGGYRPVAFMSHGIMLGLWVVTTFVTGFWLWWTGAVTELTVWPFRRPIGMGKLLLVLAVATATVRSMGAVCLGGACLLGIFQMRWVRLPVILVALLVASPVYLYLCISSGGEISKEITQFLRDVGMSEDRIASQVYRFHEEQRLLLHYQKRPALGWGDFSDDWRKAPRIAKGDYPTAVVDAQWIATLAQFGHWGLIALWLTMLLPVARFMIVHPPRLWFDPALAPAAAVAIVLMLYMLDNLSNSFQNEVYILCAGALQSVVGARLPSPQDEVHEPEPEEQDVPPEPPLEEPPSPPRRPGVLTQNQPSP
jgi:hypothetical protein